jgi:hypothetical protein
MQGLNNCNQPKVIDCLLGRMGLEEQVVHVEGRLLDPLGDQDDALGPLVAAARFESGQYPHRAIGKDNAQIEALGSGDVAGGGEFEADPLPKGQSRQFPLTHIDQTSPRQNAHRRPLGEGSVLPQASEPNTSRPPGA